MNLPPRDLGPSWTREHCIRRIKELKSRHDARIAELMQTEGDSAAILARLLDILSIMEQADEDMGTLMILESPDVAGRDGEYVRATEIGDERIRAIRRPQEQSE